MISWFCHLQDIEDCELHAIVPVFSESSQKIILSKVRKIGSEIFFKFYAFLKICFCLHLLQNIGYIPCVIQYILEPILPPNILYLLLPQVSVAQSCPTLCDPWTVSCQATLSMEFPRQEYWSG